MAGFAFVLCRGLIFVWFFFTTGHDPRLYNSLQMSSMKRIVTYMFHDHKPAVGSMNHQRDLAAISYVIAGSVAHTVMIQAVEVWFC